MKQLTLEQFHNIMDIVQTQISNHGEYLAHEYGYSGRLANLTEELEVNIKNGLLSITHLDD
ncbi:hypothetical protein [Streptococcus hyointestinalis]|uniref:hypothetical protein n=1 Tax=Streptococcus hyointestinalis TaxID=1337 RepID=UPI0013E078F9|nr:hypothetical protein [Streptococcus hyointestinalis]